MITLEDIKQISILILKEAGVTRSSIFGSYTRGAQKRDSDIDILIELSSGKSLFDLVSLQLKLEKSLQKKVDLVEFDGIKPQLKKYILDNQVKILWKETFKYTKTIISVYKKQSDIEHAFDIIKNILDIRPIYHHNDDRVKGHVFICVMAYMVARIFEIKSKDTIHNIIAKRANIKL